MFEIVLSASDLVSVIFITVELLCCPGCTGLEEIKIVDALKIAFGVQWKLNQDRNDSACARIRQNIVKYIIIPRIGFGFAFCLTEFGLLCYGNVDNLANFNPTLGSVIVVFIIMALYLAAMIYNACCTNNFSKVNFYLGLLVLYKLIDLLVNTTLLMLAKEYTFKNTSPKVNITYLLYIYSIFEVLMCAIHLLKTAVFTVRRICFKTQNQSNTEMPTVSTICDQKASTDITVSIDDTVN